MDLIIFLINAAVNIFIIYLLVTGLGWWTIPFVIANSIIVHLIRCLDPDSQYKEDLELDMPVILLLAVFNVYSWAIVYWIIFQENLFLRFYNGVALIFG